MNVTDNSSTGEHARMNRDETIKIRVSADEQRAWQTAADESGMTLSDWIRQRCNGPAAVPPVLKRKESR